MILLLILILSWYIDNFHSLPFLTKLENIPGLKHTLTLSITRSIFKKKPYIDVVDIKWKNECFNSIKGSPAFKSHRMNENLSRMENSPFMKISGKDWQILCARERGCQEHSFRARFILTPGLLTVILFMNAEYDFISLPMSSDSYAEQKLTEINRFYLNCFLSYSCLNVI